MYNRWRACLIFQPPRKTLARRQGDARLAIRANQRERSGGLAIDFKAAGGGG
jgi:hypothetical protein